MVRLTCYLPCRRRFGWFAEHSAQIEPANSISRAARRSPGQTVSPLPENRRLCLPYISELTQATTIAAADQFPLDQTNTDGTTDTRRVPASLFASWLLDQVGTVEGPQG